MHNAARKGFTTGAATYASSRRAFPAEAMPLIRDLLAGVSKPLILDLGAGTGRFTEALRHDHQNIVAVEPLANMWREFAMCVQNDRRNRRSARRSCTQWQTDECRWRSGSPSQTSRLSGCRCSNRERQQGNQILPACTGDR